MLALTMGDPAGIGPEITVEAWRRLRGTLPFVLIGDPALGRVVGSVAEASALCADALPVLPVPLPAPVIRGTPDPHNAPAVIDSIERAVRLFRDGEVSGIVTNPIAKSVLKQAGFAHPGHTEFLAALSGAPGREVMMLAGPDLRVVPVTIHVSLRQALNQLNTQEIVRVARTTAHALRRDFGIPAPRLAIAGLNPHAGEGGLMGEEERTIIRPAILQLREDGIDVSDPMPPDTMFTQTARLRYDAAICMYHDQALIPLKTIDMANGVNITLGLDLVRTSPDHGTAFDIAGQGKADPSSLVAALHMADTIARNRRSAQGMSIG